MFVLSSISSGSEFWLVNNTSIYENSESKVFKISNLWSKVKFKIFKVTYQITDQMIY